MPSMEMRFSKGEYCFLLPSKTAMTPESLIESTIPVFSETDEMCPNPCTGILALIVIPDLRMFFSASAFARNTFSVIDFFPFVEFVVCDHLDGLFDDVV